MDDDAIRCSRCGGPIDDDRAAMYDEALDPDSPEPRLCAECATESPPLAREAIRVAAERPRWAGDDADSGDNRDGDDDRDAENEPDDEEEDEDEEPDDEEGGYPETPEDVLRDILRQLKNVVRNQEYEEFSIWNIFAGLLQCLVLALLFLNVMNGGTPDLMWAVVVQLMVLTFFVKARK